MVTPPAPAQPPTTAGRAALVPLDRFTTLADGLDHPEGVAYGPDGHLYAGGEAGQLYRSTAPVRPPAPCQMQELASTGGFILGLTLDARANLYACDSRRRQVVRVTPDGRVGTYSTGTAEHPLRTPNFPVFDRQGRLYVADSGAWQAGDGRLYRVDPDGTTLVASTAPHRFPNGLALSPAGDWLYVAESTLPGVGRLPVRRDGSLGELEAVVALPGDVPDGLAFDVAGNLYISCYRPDRIYRLSAVGELVVFGEDPAGTVLAAPTNVAFCGPGLEYLVAASLGRWHLAAAPVEVPGQALQYPDLPPTS
jgi:gluconolactonase